MRRSRFFITASVRSAASGRPAALRRGALVPLVLACLAAQAMIVGVPWQTSQAATWSVGNGYLTGLHTDTTGTVDVARNFAAILNGPLTGTNTLLLKGGYSSATSSMLSLINRSGNTFSGNIMVDVDGGTLRVAGNAYAAGADKQGLTLPDMTSTNSIVVRRGGFLTIDDNVSTSAGYVANRFGSESNRPAVVLEGGTLSLNGANYATATTQTLGQLTLASGPSVVSVTRNTAGTPGLLFDSLLRSNGAYATFSGTSLGTAAANVPQIVFSATPAMVGAAGAEGTKTMSIVPGARSGNDLVWHGTYGIRGLLAAEYSDFAGNDINAAGSTENVRMTGATPTTWVALNAPKTVNALVLTAAGNGTWPMSNTLTLTSGQLLSTPNNTRSITNGTLTAGSGSDIDLHATILQSTMTIGTSATIADNGAGKVALVKSGAGTLALANNTTDNGYSGGTVVNEGTLSSSTTDGRRYLGSGPARVDNAVLTLGHRGATSFSTANQAGYTALNGAQVNIANQAYTTASDRFDIHAGSVLAGSATTTAGNGLNSLTRVSSLTGISGGQAVLAPGAIVAFGGTLTTGLGAGVLQLAGGAGTAADLYFGLAANTVASSTLTLGSGTPWRGLSTDRSARNYLSGTITANGDFDLQGFAAPGAIPVILNMGSTGPIAINTPSGSVNANIRGAVTWTTASTALGSANNNVTFVVTPGATFTLTPANALGASAGSAVGVTVQEGGILAIGNTAAINAATTVQRGGRFNASVAGGPTGTGALTLESGSIVHISNATGFSGAQASGATIQPGAIFRLGLANVGTAAVSLDSVIGAKNQIYEVYGGTFWPINPASAGTTIMTLNRSAGGVGGMLVNDNASRSLGAVANGVITIGSNGGTLAATDGTTMTVLQGIALGTNALFIGSTEAVDGSPRAGIVSLTAGAGVTTASAGARVNVVTGQLTIGTANTLPSLVDVDIAPGATLYVGAAQTLTGRLTDSPASFINGAAALTLNRGAGEMDTLDSTIGPGAFALTKQGAGTVVLTGTNTYTGINTLSAGILRAEINTNALGLNTSAAALTLSGAGAELQLAGDGDLSFGRHATLSATMQITSDRVVPGAGTTHSLGNLTFSGARTLIAAGGEGVLSGAAGLTLGNVALAANSSGFAVSNPPFGGEMVLTLGGILSGNFSWSKSGPGTLRLAGAATNTSTGAVTIDGGKLVLAKTGTNAQALVSGAITVNSGGVLEYAPASENTNLVGTAAVTINGTGRLDFNGSTDSVGNVSVVATGAGADSRALTNTAGGGLLMTGTLGITPAADCLSTLDMGSGALRLGGTVTFTAATTGRARLAGNLDLGTASRVFTVSAGTGADYDVLVDANVASPLGLYGINKQGAGRLVLAGMNTHSGVTACTAGTLVLADSLAAQHSTLSNAAAGVVLFSNATAFAVGALWGAGGIGLTNTAGQAVTLTLGADGESRSFTGALSGPGSLVKLGTGTQTLTAPQYGGDTTVSNGVLRLSAAGLADGADVSIASPGKLDLNHGSVDAVRELYIDGQRLPPGVYSSQNLPTHLSGPGSLQVTSSGTPLLCYLYPDSLGQGKYDADVITFTAVVTGANTNGLTYAWDFGNDASTEFSGAAYRTVTNHFPAAGPCTVRLTVSNELSESATYLWTGTVFFSPRRIWIKSWYSDGNTEGREWGYEAFSSFNDAVTSGIFIASYTIGDVTLVVPTNYATIQAALSAAPPCNPPSTSVYTTVEVYTNTEAGSGGFYSNTWNAGQAIWNQYALNQPYLAVRAITNSGPVNIRGGFTLNKDFNVVDGFTIHEAGYGSEKCMFSLLGSNVTVRNCTTLATPYALFLTYSRSAGGFTFERNYCTSALRAYGSVGFKNGVIASNYLRRCPLRLAVVSGYQVVGNTFVISDVQFPWGTNHAGAVASTNYVIGNNFCYLRSQDISLYASTYTPYPAVVATNNWWGHVNGPYDPTGVQEVDLASPDTDTDWSNAVPDGELGAGIGTQYHIGTYSQSGQFTDLGSTLGTTNIDYFPWATQYLDNGWTLEQYPSDVYVNPSYSNGGFNDGYVWGSNAFSSIQTAVDNVAPYGGRVWLSADTFVISNQISVQSTINIYGTAGVTRVQAAYPSTTNRCFYLNDAWARLDGIIIENGHALGALENGVGGGVYIRNAAYNPNAVANVTMSDCVLLNNEASIAGGGVYLPLDKYTDIDGCSFVSNKAPRGGGICAETWVWTHDCAFIGNEATNGSGGGLYLGGTVPPFPLSYYRLGQSQGAACSVIGNTASANGGGLYLGYGIIRDWAFSGNLAAGGSGGAVYSAGAGLERLAVSNNWATNGSGGGISVVTGSVGACTVVMNMATNGGGGLYAVTSTVTNCTFAANTAGAGGGAYVLGGFFVQNELAGNAAAGVGGGLCQAGGTVSNSVLTANSAGLEGGGAWMTNACVARNCLYTYNSAGTRGGGLFLATAGSTNENGTVAYNTAASGGGVAMQDGMLRNAMVYYNQPRASNVDRTAGTIEYSSSRHSMDAYGDGNASAEYPGFVKPEHGDFRLNTASPGADGGTNQPWMTGALDLAGSNRVTGVRVNMGAYETTIDLPRQGTYLQIL